MNQNAMEWANREELKTDLIRFLATRDLSTELKQFFKSQTQMLEGVFYRGLPFPEHLLKVGAVIEEWHGSTHWSLDEVVAQGFATDYINEDYYADLQEELGLREVPFVELVLVAEQLPGMVLSPLLEELDITNFRKEKEVTVVGYDFKIESIKSVYRDNVYYYYAKVVPVA